MLFKTVLADILLKRGNLIDIPRLREAEFGYTVDTSQLFIGTKDGNIEVPLLNGKSKEARQLEMIEKELLKLKEENEKLKDAIAEIEKSSPAIKIVSRLTNADVNYVKLKRKEEVNNV